MTLLREIAHRSFRRLGFDVRSIHNLEGAARAMAAERARRDLRWLGRLGVRTVLDVGAHRGEFAAWVHDLLPQARIECFEPVQESYAALLDALARIPNSRAHRVAMGAAGGKTRMRRNLFTPSSSILPMARLHQEQFPHTAGAPLDEEIEMSTLDSVLADRRPAAPYLLKIDTQGYEAEVIRGATATLQDTALVIVEASFFELYEGQPLFPDLHRQMADLGFFYGGSVGQIVSPSDGLVLQQDALFFPASFARQLHELAADV